MSKSRLYIILFIGLFLTSCYKNASCEVMLNLDEQEMDTSVLFSDQLFIKGHDTMIMEIVAPEYYQYDSVGFDIDMSGGQPHCTVGIRYMVQFRYIGGIMEEAFIEFWSNEKLKPDVWNGPTFKYSAFSWSELENPERDFEIVYDVNRIDEVDTIVKAKHPESYIQQLIIADGDFSAFIDRYGGTWTKVD